VGCTAALDRGTTASLGQCDADTAPQGLRRAVADVIKDLDGALRYLVEELGYEKYPALWEIEARIWDGQLRLTRQRHVDGKPYSPSHGTLYNQEPVKPAFFRSKLALQFDSHDRVQVVSQRMGFEWWEFRYGIAEGCDVRAIWPLRSPAQQNKLGAPLEHDWDDYKQKFLQLWQEKGDFQLPQNQVAGWNSQAAAAKTLLNYIQARCKDGEEPHEKTVEGYISGWAKNLRAPAEHN
jgi:hypothetical protein